MNQTISLLLRSLLCTKVNQVLKLLELLYGLLWWGNHRFSLFALWLPCFSGCVTWLHVGRRLFDQITAIEGSRCHWRGSQGTRTQMVSIDQIEASSVLAVVWNILWVKLGHWGCRVVGDLMQAGYRVLLSWRLLILPKIKRCHWEILLGGR